MSKCNICNKKINMILKEIYLCRCTKYYCSIHKHNHNCQFDYKKLFIIKDLIKIEFEKNIRI